MDCASEMQGEESDNSSSPDASSVAFSDGDLEELMPSTFKRLATSDTDRGHCFITIKSKVIHLELVDHKFWCGQVLHHRSAEPPGKISAMLKL